MTPLQKVIRYCSLGLAMFLIVSIISAIIMGFYGLINALGLALKNDDVVLHDLKCSYDNITELNIDINASNLKIKISDTFMAQTNSDTISCRKDNGELIITEKNTLKVGLNEVVLYVPSDFVFDDVHINTKVGNVLIDKLITDKLVLDLGAGQTKIDNLISSNSVIDAGAGKLEIASGVINNLDFDMGVGAVDINAKITGTNEIDTGVGALNLVLFGGLEDYKIEVDKGIGNIVVDNQKLADGEIIGSGHNILNIDGGIGEVKISFQNE